MQDTTSEFWDPINKQGEKFWDGLEWTKDAVKDFGRTLRHIIPFPFSSPSRNGYGSRKGKNSLGQ